MKSLLHKLNPRFPKDFVLSIFANTFSYLVTFCGAVIYVRLLGKSSYGLYTFAFNIISLFFLINAFGAASGILQYVSKAKTDAEQHEYLRFAFQMGSVFNVGMSLLIIIYALYFPLPIPQAKPVLLAMSLFPIMRLYIDLFPAYLRATQQNIAQARFAITNSITLLLCNFIGVWLFHLYGLIFSTYILYIGMFIYTTYKLKLSHLFILSKFPTVNRRQFIGYSFFSSLSNAFSGLLFVLDILIISYIIKDTNLIATYKVATIIPFAINFVPGLVMNFYYPEFVKNLHDHVKLKQLKQFIRVRMFIFSFTTSIILILLARPIILTVFGSHYTASILPFQIISFGYWIAATFRIVNGNILAAHGKAKLSFYLTLMNLLINVATTYILVKYFSITGAAIAIVIMYIVSSVVSQIALSTIETY